MNKFHIYDIAWFDICDIYQFTVAFVSYQWQLLEPLGE